MRHVQRKQRARITLPEFGQQAGQQAERHAIGAGNADQTTPYRFQPFDFRQRIRHITLTFANVMRKKLSRLGQHHAASMTPEQRGTDLRLQALNLTADGRHRNKELLAGGAQRAAFSDRQKVADLVA